jgi:hypothetical protein
MDLTDEHRRALLFLAHHPHGYSEAVLIQRGFTTVLLGQLLATGSVKMRSAGRQKVVLIKITMAGKRAIAD